MSRLARLILLGYILFFNAACTARPTPSPTASVNQVNLEEQAVYAYLLAKLYEHKDYVIMATTATGASGVDDTAQTLDYVLQNMHALDPDTLASFKARNDAAYPLTPDMNLGNPYTLLTQAERSRIFGQNQSGWEIFYNLHPQAPGITTLSRVGFNAALDQALVYIGTQSNWLAGSGYYILLKKDAGSWSIDQQVMTWVS
jgi:hypothetical protein